MDIQLKKLKLYLGISEETIAFSADLYIDNQYAAYLSNKGHGDPINIDWNRDLLNAQQLIEAADDYCGSLPPVESEFSTEPLNQDLELFISMMVGDAAAEKDRQSAEKKFNRDIQKGICYGKNALNYTIVTWKKHTIASLLAIQQGKEVLKREVQKIKAQGKTVLNTNLPEDVLSA